MLTKLLSLFVPENEIAVTPPPVLWSEHDQVLAAEDVIIGTILIGPPLYFILQDIVETEVIPPCAAHL